MFEDIIGLKKEKTIRVSNVTKVYCYNCNYSIQLSKREIGTTVKCPNCGSSVIHLDIELPNRR